MDDPLDNDLQKRIRELFDNYDDNTADEGWLRLREKFPVDARLRPVIWFWRLTAAATLLLFISIGTWMFVNRQVIKPIVFKPLVKHQPVEQNNSANNTELALKDKLVDKHQPLDSGRSLKNNTANQYKIISKNTAAISSTVNLITGAESISTIDLHAIKKPTTSVNTSPANNQGLQILNNTDSVNTPVIKANPSTYATTAPVSKNPGMVNPTNSALENKLLEKVKKPVPANSMDALFAAVNTADNKVDKISVNDKKIKFSVYAATFFNYAKGSNNQVNAGAGFTSDIRLSKNIKLSTGIALAQNTLSYKTATSPISSSTNSMVAFAAVAKQDLAVSHTAALPVFKNYNASLVGLDIPLNIKYEFNPQNSDTYISAGLSSGTFINEAYTTSYGLPQSAITAGATQQTTNQTSNQNFNSFYFAKTLNVSFGIGAPVGNNRLIIEPFLKYPLDGLGSQQIKFGAGGLNLKLNISGKRK